MKNEWNHHKLIAVIVKRGASRKILKAAKEAGSQGGTVMFAKWSGSSEMKSFLGIPMESEKEIALILIPEDQLEQVLEAVERSGRLNKPGNGFGFVLDTKQIAGMTHLFQQSPHL